MDWKATDRRKQLQCGRLLWKKCRNGSWSRKRKKSSWVPHPACALPLPPTQVFRGQMGNKLANKNVVYSYEVLERKKGGKRLRIDERSSIGHANRVKIKHVGVNEQLRRKWVYDMSWKCEGESTNNRLTLWRNDRRSALRVVSLNEIDFFICNCQVGCTQSHGFYLQGLRVTSASDLGARSQKLLCWTRAKRRRTRSPKDVHFPLQKVLDLRTGVRGLSNPKWIFPTGGQAPYRLSHVWDRGRSLLSRFRTRDLDRNRCFNAVWAIFPATVSILKHFLGTMIWESNRIILGENLIREVCLSFLRSLFEQSSESLLLFGSQSQLAYKKVRTLMVRSRPKKLLFCGVHVTHSRLFLWLRNYLQESL